MTRQAGIQTPAKGGSNVGMALRQEFASVSQEWLQARWRDVASAVKTRSEDAVVEALRVIYDIAPEDSLRSMAQRYIGGVS